MAKKSSKRIKVFVIVLIVVLSLLILSLIAIKVLNFKSFPLDFNINGQESIKINLNDEYKEEGYSAKFLFVDVSDAVKVENNINNSVPGKYTVKYSYKNKFSDKTIERSVEVIDNIAPTLTLEKEKITIYEGGVIHTGKIKAKDNIDGNISKNVIVDNLDTSTPGKYKLKVSVSDSSGNTTSKDIDVTIKKKEVRNGSVNARIDVYISEQKLYYYEKNKLILTSDVVTGKKDGTPRGHYKVLRKKEDVYLKGDTFLDHVDYWIAFIGGLYGLHDASWRNEFGGDIFLTDGSHGCVNMPLKNIKKLYERVEIGTAVNIYD